MRQEGLDLNLVEKEYGERPARRAAKPASDDVLRRYGIELTLQAGDMLYVPPFW